VVYQIYPRSFQDSTGNGVGDLPGITSRLGHLDRLGVDALWLSPFYPSPMADFGYDVSDYTDVDPLFGTLEDFDRLLADAHRRGIRVIIDWVPNHTSDRHPWFVESRSSRDNPRRDWYVWRDARPGDGPPNNWESQFGGSAWAWDASTEQYYLHSFLEAQPDLNWRNPEVRNAMFETIRFWLDRGVDGYRIDVAHFVMKDPEFRDNPAAHDSRSGVGRHLGHEDNHDLYRELRTILDSYGQDRFAVGEIHISDESRWASYYGESGDELHMPFNFSLLSTPWDAGAIRDQVEAIESVVPEGSWPNYVLGNHDQPRIAGRVGRTRARLHDPVARTLPGEGRDGCRTPMQWDTGPTAGFSDAPIEDLWLPLNPDHATNNVETQEHDPTSMLSLTGRLLDLRRHVPALRVGSYRSLAGIPDGVYGYERSSPEGSARVYLNFTARSQRIVDEDGRVLLSTHPERSDGDSPGSLAPDEGIVCA
jgi:glycosidase